MHLIMAIKNKAWSGGQLHIQIHKKNPQEPQWTHSSQTQELLLKSALVLSLVEMVLSQEALRGQKLFHCFDMIYALSK